MKRRALVLGATGQTGSYLTDLLLEKGYKVYALIRRTSTPSTSRLAHVLDLIEVVPGDITDEGSLQAAIGSIQPQEIYNFAAQSHVGESFASPLTTADVTGLGALRVFDTARMRMPASAHVRIYQASSSEMFGQPLEDPQTELTPLRPISPYGCAKVFAHTCAETYRRSYGLWIACGIAYNHESERRGETFVTRKITKAVARIKVGTQQYLHLGNLSAQRDWLHAEDVAMGAWQALQTKDVPEDFVFASGIPHSVKEFADAAFKYAGLQMREHLIIDPHFFRPTDIACLRGNAAKAHRMLQWEVRTDFYTLVRRMVDHDLAEAQRDCAREAAGRPESAGLPAESVPTDVPRL